MRKYIFKALFAFLFTASQLFAQNGVVFDMKFSSSMGANGSIKAYFSSIGKRTEMTASIPQLPDPIRTITITKTDKPEVLITINETNKTYSESPVKKDTKTQTYTIENLGEEKIMGYKCKHINVTGSDGSVTEIWNTKDIADYQKYKDAYNANPRLNISAMEKALIEAGVDGFAVKYIIKGKKEGDMTMELVKMEKKSTDKSLFEIPAAYTKTEGANNGGYRNPNNGPGAMTPEEREKKRDEMKAKQNGNK